MLMKMKLFAKQKSLYLSSYTDKILKHIHAGLKQMKMLVWLL